MNRQDLKLDGIAASPGIAIGKAFVHRSERPAASLRRVPDYRVESEIQRFHAALSSVSEDMRRTRQRVEHEHGADLAMIFEAQRTMLDDMTMKDGTVDCIRSRNWSAERAFSATMAHLREGFEKIDNEYLRARVGDLKDIEQQVLVHLAGGSLSGLQSARSNTVIFARELLPSEAAQLGRRLVKGLVTDVGGTTTHTSIIARSLGLPTVVGTEKASRQVAAGDPVIVDGDRGTVHIRPDAATVRYYRSQLRRQLRRERELSQRRDLPAVTRDGAEITLLANVDLPQEIEQAVASGAHGVGMVRSEFLYLGYGLPSEAEQLDAYAQIVSAMAPLPVVIRTFDLGGDKLTHAVDSLPEDNPYLGWRGIRICLDTPELFKTQLRAILRAGTKGDARILLPMISGLDEVRRARQMIAEVQQELRQEGIAHQADCQVGVMIEVPSAAITSEQLAREADFFSLGTNDLVQYTLAVDRGTARVANLYDPLHPAVLRLIKQVADNAQAAGIPVSICGEMAADPVAAVLLLGLGVRLFSVSPAQIPELKEVVRAADMATAQQVAGDSLALTSGIEVRAHVEATMKQVFLTARPPRQEEAP
ncbi:MAG TPA: phosphoenolpyruvate--protein phosphotransferase [Candidatus Latescibacteria bacterium]|jgi:phosphotransferase system enzyme I (PtsI)|nr:phosphoenolpyruvate--protein phosphotransferase [Candidatus Latescibacterota bacterium]